MILDDEIFTVLHCFRFRYFQEVLASPTLPADLNEIQLHKDGSWSTQVADKKITKSEKVPIDDSIEIIGDDVGKSNRFHYVTVYYFCARVDASKV
jgi:hypothetical protein